MDGLKVEARPSEIIGAGTGLFAKSAISKGEVICEYSGRVLTLEQAKSLKDRTYLKAVTLNRHIDGESIAKYINDHCDKSRHNVKFEKRDLQIFIVATREIHPNEELFVSYGRGHWLFVGSKSFLGLEIDASGSLLATHTLEKNEVVLCFESPAMLDIDGLAKSVRFSTVLNCPSSNCRLKPSPFVRNTVVVSALRVIASGEEIVVRLEDALDVKPSSIQGAGMGAFTRTKIEEGAEIGVYEGKILSQEAFEQKRARASGVRFYALMLSDDHWIDPTDEKGTARPFHCPGVCFINENQEREKINCKFERDTSKSSPRVIVRSIRTIHAGEELFLHYEGFLLREWV